MYFNGSVTRFGNFCALGNFLKPLAKINLHKSPTFLGNFCKGVKIYHFSGEIIFGQLLWTFGNFFSGHTVQFCFSTIWNIPKHPEKLGKTGTTKLTKPVSNRRWLWHNLVEQSLPTTEIRGSNPVIIKFYIVSTVWKR